MRRFFIHLFFLFIVVGDLSGELLQIKWIDYSFKPFILIWIGGYFLMHSKNIDKTIVKLAVLAFFFSWGGDVLLMFIHKSSLFFILGLSSFLIVQIVYIFLFLKTIKLSGKQPFLKKKPYYLLVYVAYGLIVYTFLFSYLDFVFRIALFVYMVALLSMSSMALNRYGNGHPKSFIYVFFGSILFVISDTLIAINKFVVEIPYEGLFVMTTYICAQFFIMRGLLKQYETD